MLPFRAAVLFCLHSNGAISGVAFPCISSNHMWAVRRRDGAGRELKSLRCLRRCVQRKVGKQLSAFPGNILTSSVTDSRDMANDSLDCSDHRYDEHENH